MIKLKTLIAELESKIPHHELINEKISNSNVGWHVEHSLLTINAIIDRIQQTNHENYIKKFNFSKFVVFTIGKIPRGRGKAPRAVVPAEYNDESLQIHITKMNSKADALSKINPDQYFEHPYFGHLKLKETIKFLEIHTIHHIKIINDIVKSKVK